MILKPIDKSEIKGRAGAFFRSTGWKNTLVFFCFVVLASAFWMLQYFHGKFEFEVPMKVRYVHIPTGVAISDKLPQEVTLYVQDKGSAYLNYFIKKRAGTLYITVDLENVTQNRASYIIDPATLQSLIAEKLSAATLLKSFSPSRIEINYSPLEQKDLPVTIQGIVSPAFGYLISDSIRIEPAQVTAYGDKNTLDTIHAIQTVPLDYGNIDKNWTVTAGLQAPAGIRLSINNVKLSATVEEYTEKTFEIPVVCIDIPPDRKVHFFPSAVELSVKVGLSKYSLLSKSNFEINVNYDDLKLKNTANCSLTLTRKPDWVDSYRIAPEVIEFLIEQKSD